jgi:hypothetical protein
MFEVESKTPEVESSLIQTPTSVTSVITLNLLQLYIDVSQRRTLNDPSSSQPHSAYVFSRGDTLKGSLYAFYPTGQSNPMWYLLNVPTFELALTDGASKVYATATGWESLGGGTTPHQSFDLDVTGTALDAALTATTNQSINAFLEIHLVGMPVSEGSSYPQDAYMIRDQAVIYKTALNPLS